MTPASSRLGRGGGRLVVAASLAFAALYLIWQLLVPASPAAAHAVLESSSPVDGSRVATAPAQVTFTFDEAVQLPPDATATLSDHGVRVDSGPARLADSGKTVVIPLRKALADGAYTASYRVVSADGHVVTGAIRFGLNADPATAGSTTPTPIDPVEVAAESAQGLVYGGVVLLIGVSFAGLVLWPSVGSRRGASVLRWVGWSLLAGGTLLRLLLAGPAATGSGWGGVFRLDGIGTALAEVGGVAGLVRLVLLVVLIPWVVRPGRGRASTVASAVLGVAVLCSIAADGHAAAGDDAWLALPVTTLHLAAMALWVGGLIVLAVFVIPAHGRDQDELTRQRRWSVAAFACVAVLIVTGEYQAWRQLDPLQSISATAYGVTLLIKLVLVALAITAALVSNRLLVRNGPPRDARERHRARRIVATEAVITLVVVVVTTVLVALPPARTTYGPPTTLTAAAGTGTAHISVDSTHVGPQTITVQLEDASGQPATADAITGTLGTTTVAGVTLRFERTRNGEWVAHSIAPVAGEWTVALSVDFGTGAQYATSAVYRVWG
ncbi:FixH family protein [Streptomyces sp. L7]|uniref:copper resistance CopC/CopD family protein n=1 Tax=Streptomyces sp. L7 TaxID=3423954 RepID=UPI003D99C30F